VCQTRLKLSCKVHKCKPLVSGRGAAEACAGLGQGRAVQVDPFTPTLTAPGTKRLKVKLDKAGFKFCFHLQLAPLQQGVLVVSGRP